MPPRAGPQGGCPFPNLKGLLSASPARSRRRIGYTPPVSLPERVELEQGRDGERNCPGTAGPAISAALLALALYAVTLGGTYIYDDLFIVTEDPRLHDTSRWIEYWTNDYAAGALDRLYRPLVSLSYAVQWRLHGDRPWAFHAVNWLLHAVVSALVAELARRLSGTRTAYAAGLLFAAHPVHVEAVANVVGRAELMCAAGVLGALVIAARTPLTPPRAVAIVACFVLALLSKEQGMLLPLLLLFLGLVSRARAGTASTGTEAPGRTSHAQRQLLLLLVFALCVTLAAYIVFRESTIRFTWDRNKLDWVMNPLVRSQGADRWLMPLALLGRYTALLIAPVTLSIDYGADVIGSVARRNDPYLWLGALSLAVWTALIVASVVRRSWAMLFCLLATAVMYGPAANFVSLIGTIFGERLMYLPSAFFVILLGMATAQLSRRTASVLLFVLITAWGVRTFAYARQWNDRLAFYEASLRHQPESTQLYLLLSTEYRLTGNLERAGQVIEEALRKWPDYWLAHSYAALVALERGNLYEAEYHARRSTTLEPSMLGLAVAQRVFDAKAATQPTATQPASSAPAPAN